MAADVINYQVHDSDETDATHQETDSDELKWTC